MLKIKNKHNVVYTYNRIIFSLEKKKEIISNTIWMILGDVMLNEMNQSERADTV